MATLCLHPAFVLICRSFESLAWLTPGAAAATPWATHCVEPAGQIERTTQIYIVNSHFTANNATNYHSQQAVLPGLFDVGECAGAHISSCTSVGILNSTFNDNIAIGLCLRDISGGPTTALPLVPPLFDRDTIAGPYNVMVDDFLGNDVSVVAALDIRSTTFRGNTAASLARLDSEPEQPVDPLAGGAGLDIIAVPYLILDSLMFEDNTGRQGSAIHFDTCTDMIIWNCVFNKNNTATNEGGAIATVNSHGKGILLGESKVTNSLALSGGALYGDSGATIVVTNNTQLSNNTAVTNGGGVSCVGCQTLTLQMGAAATANMASEGGGACYCEGCTLFQLDHVQLSNYRCDSMHAQHVYIKSRCLFAAICMLLYVP